MKKIKLKANKSYLLSIELDGDEIVRGVAKLESVEYRNDCRIVTIRLIPEKT